MDPQTSSSTRNQATSRPAWKWSCLKQQFHQRRTHRSIGQGYRPNTIVQYAFLQPSATITRASLVDAESKSVSGALLGIEGDEVVLERGLMYARTPYTVMQRAVHAHG